MQRQASAGPAAQRDDATTLVVLVALLAAFSPALLAMSKVWSAVDYQAHGYLVGPVAVAMGLSRLRAARAAAGAPHPAGLAVVTLALLLYAMGILADVLSLQGIALPLAVAGALAWRLGGASLAILAPAVAYLVFMVPPPPSWLTPLVTSLQGWVSQVAIALLLAAQVPALREGNVIVLPEGSLFVAEACSGITSIVTLLPVAALLAFLMSATRRQTAWLLVAVVPVAMFWNLARVLATVAATRAVGVVQATTGSLHDTAGLLTFTLGCLSLLGVAAWLARARPGALGPAGE